MSANSKDNNMIAWLMDKVGGANKHEVRPLWKVYRTYGADGKRMSRQEARDGVLRSLKIS